MIMSDSGNYSLKRQLYSNADSEAEAKVKKLKSLNAAAAAGPALESVLKVVYAVTPEVDKATPS